MFKKIDKVTDNLMGKSWFRGLAFIIIVGSGLVSILGIMLIGLMFQ